MDSFGGSRAVFPEPGPKIDMLTSGDNYRTNICAIGSCPDWNEDGSMK
jgi:hypothetical protein